MRKNDEICEPLRLTDGNPNISFQVLCNAIAIFKNWKSSGQAGLTQETFTACIQSLEVMIVLADHLLKNHSFIYVLPGKFCSDPLEGRFGWYRQVNGGNFFMSIKQLFQAEKKIRCLSLVRQQILHSASRLNIQNDLLESMEEIDDIDENPWLYEFLVRAELGEIPDADACVAYYVSARSISRRRRCSDCKGMLVKCDDHPELDVHEGSSELLQIANRGGLSVPSEYSFAVCSLAVQMYTMISSDETIKTNLLCLSNPRSAFSKAVIKVAKDSATHEILTRQKCCKGHANFYLILQIAFNCFAKNELKRLNAVGVDAPERMARSIRKLSSKNSCKQ